jgi:hypothetical protein
LLRSYQEEVDNLTKRAKFGENAFLNIYQKLYEAPDPYPALASMAVCFSFFFFVLLCYTVLVLLILVEEHPWLSYLLAWSCFCANTLQSAITKVYLLNNRFLLKERYKRHISVVIEFNC